MSTPRNTSWLYRCRRCGKLQRRGSSAKYCDRVHWSGTFMCRGVIERLCTISGPVTDPVPQLKVRA